MGHARVVQGMSGPSASLGRSVRYRRTPELRKPRAIAVLARREPVSEAAFAREPSAGAPGSGARRGRTPCRGSNSGEIRGRCARGTRSRAYRSLKLLLGGDVRSRSQPPGQASSRLIPAMECNWNSAKRHSDECIPISEKNDAETRRSKQGWGGAPPNPASVEAGCPAG